MMFTVNKKNQIFRFTTIVITGNFRSYFSVSANSIYCSNRKLAPKLIQVSVLANYQVYSSERVNLDQSVRYKDQANNLF